MKKTFLNCLLVSLFALTTAGCGGNATSSSKKISSSNTLTSSKNETTSKESSNNVSTESAAFNGIINIYYFKADMNYKDWELWMWPKGKGNGGQFAFTGETTIYDKTFKTLTIDTNKKYNDICAEWKGCDDPSDYVEVDFNERTEEQIGFLARKVIQGAEPEKDGDGRFMDLTKTDSEGNVNLYLIYGNKTMFYKEEDIKELVLNKIDLATAVSPKSIYVEAMDVLPSSSASYSIKNGEEEIAIDTLKVNDKIATINLLKELDFTKEVRLSITDMGKTVVTLDGIYDSEYFINNFTTTEKLGAIYEKDGTTFKVWSPYASKIRVKMYRYGDANGKDSKGNVIHPAEPTHIAMKSLVRGEKGVWSVKYPGDLQGQYYTYEITINGVTYENVVDPYALSVGVNGDRGMIVDMSKCNPEGWENVKQPELDSCNEPIVYELHTRDLTSDKTWQGKQNSINRGKYLGLIEEGTTYTNKNGQTTKTGFDYIKDLGVSHVQLLPINDSNSVNETMLDDEEYQNKVSGGIFSWGYDPKNYAAPEGSYSLNPFDGYERIKELKKVSKAYNENGIGLILDVVFNHMYNTTSGFNSIVPGYYFRSNNYGKTITNYSGAGADVASEREMMKNYICDNLKMWTEEYKFAGYRYDIMGMISIETIQKALEAVQEVDPDCVMYGEGWQMCGNSWNGIPLAVQENINNVGSVADNGFVSAVGAFNDGFRTAVKGDADNNSMSRGWIYGNGESYNALKWALSGSLGATDQYSSSEISQVSAITTYNKMSAGASINYVECHDNTTLADKISKTTKGSLKSRQDYQTLATSLCIFSQGITFIQAGQEMLRSKKVPASWSEGINSEHVDGGYFSNTYNYGDEVNSIKWDLAIQNGEVVNSIKNMLKLKRDHLPIFSQKNPQTINDNMRFLNTGNNTLMAYTIKPDTTKAKDSWEVALVLHNSLSNEQSFNLDGSWTLALKNGVYTTNPQTVNGKISIPGKGTVILYR